MSSSVDERIVEMTFKGSSFAQDVAGAASALSSLKAKLASLKGSGDAISDIDAAGKRFSLSGMMSGLESVGSKFSALSVIGVTALATITSKAVSAGLELAKAFTIDPIKEGFQQYQAQINATKTIMANSGASLDVVTKKLDALNVYANQTIYSFTDMATAIGQFSSAGVPLNQAVQAIKGMGNSAALSGAGVQQLQSATYQMSQALSGGVIHLQDWNSLQQANVASGKNFQKIFEDTSATMGKNVTSIVKSQGGFRNSLQTGWLTAGVFTKAMDVMAGQIDKATGKTVAYSVAQLKAMGYTTEQAKNINRLSAAAISSATQIRTFTQLMDTLKDETSTAWAAVFKALVGNAPQAAAIFTGVHNVLENMFTGPTYKLANFITEFRKIGGIKVIISTIAAAFKDVELVLAPIKQAFRDIFPAATAQQILAIAKAIEAFVKNLSLSANGAKELRSTFDGIFSVFKIVTDVIKGVFIALGQMTGAAGKGAGGILSLTGRIGDFITHLKNVIESGNGLNNFFKKLGQVLSLPVKLLALIVGGFGNFVGAITHVMSAISPFVGKITNAMKKIGDAIINGITSGNFSQVANLLNQGLFAGVLLAIRNFIKNLGKGGEEESTGFFATIKESFEGLTGALKTMQATLRAAIILEIAIAVGVLAASMLVLSKLNVADLTKSLSAMTIMFTELLTALSIVIKVGGSAGILKMVAIGLALNLLATAILILAGAVAILAQFSWSQIEKGLVAVGGLLLELAIATKIMSSNSVGLIASAYAMQIIAVAMNLLAIAVGKFGNMNWEQLGKGIGSIAALLLVMAGFNKISGAQTITTGLALLIIAAAINVMADAVTKLGALPIEAIGKGLLAIAGGLAIIALAMNLMPPDMALSAVGLIVVAAALEILSDVLAKAGGMSWDAIAKSLVELAGALVIIAVGMALMTEALPGAAALLVVSAALAILAPVLVTISTIPWEGIAKGLIALAGVFIIIAAAGIIMAPLVPVLLGLGAAIGILGLGILAAGAGVALFAVGLTGLAVAVTASGVAILSFFKSVLQLIPTAMTSLGEGLVDLAKVISQGGPAILSALATILVALAGAIIKAVPKLAQAAGVLLTNVLGMFNRYEPQIVNTFLRLLVELVSAVGAHVGALVGAAVNLIVRFLNAIAAGVPKMAQAGGNIVIAFINAVGTQTARIAAAGERMVISLINSVANTIRGNTGAMRSAAFNLGSALVDGMTLGLAGAVGRAVAAAEHVASSIVGAVKGVFKSKSPSRLMIDMFSDDVVGGMVIGLQNGTPDAVAAATTTSSSIATALADSMSGLSDAVSANVNLTPTITPVIDLSRVKAGMSEVSDLTKTQLIAATASTAVASSVASSEISPGGSSAQNTLTYEQNIYSPKAVDATTVFRQTKSQLSTVKGALASANTS